MQRRLRDLLRRTSLTEREIDLYILLLKLRSVTIPRLAAESHLPHITVYRTIKHLEERGLVVGKPMNNKQSVYSPLSLEALIAKISCEQRKLRKLELSLRGLDALLPYMDIEEDREETIELREGVEAFREEYLKMPDVFKDEYLHIGSTPGFWETAQMTYESPEERSFIHRRLAKNLFARVLDPPSPQAEVIQRNDSREKRTMQLRGNLPITKDFLMIAEDQVSHFICEPADPRVVVIRAPELVRAHRTQFDMLWAQRNA
ncbi:MAG: helix-turn-helix domain-containing protein [Candidatus Peregrinibacteria bacterium]|nr:helix-turn-helix domain-containing protein [Candidatus Peregrinibacteria bacterium]